MIRFFIKNGNNSVKFDAPTDELFDHLGSIGINEDIPITCSESIGTVFVNFDNGRSLGICPEVDSFHKIAEQTEVQEPKMSM